MYYFSIMEENELSFIELFAQKIIVSRYVTLYYNSVMHDDDFFNRIVVKEFNANTIEDIAKAEEILKSKGVTPFIYSMVKSISIEEYGYSLYDELITLFNNDDKIGLVDDNNITVRDVKEDEDVSIWIDVFSNSFNISHYRDEIRERVTRAINTSNRLILRLAYKGDYNNGNNKPIGCSALFLTSSVIGLYCLGVLPDYRRRGIAGSLISNALLEAKSRGLMLVVQTFARDNLVPLYSKHGFTYAYSKFIYCNNQ